MSDMAPAENAGANAASDAGQTVDGSASSFITIKEVNMMSRGRTLRLQADDVIIAIDGEPFHGSIDELLDALDEADPDDGVLMALWRQGMIFRPLCAVRSVVFSSIQLLKSRKRSTRTGSRQRWPRLKITSCMKCSRMCTGTVRSLIRGQTRSAISFRRSG